MFRQAVLFAVFSLVCYLVSEYRVLMDVDRVLYTTSPGTCKTILKGGGSEDFAELDEETILFSSGLNFLGKPGKISALYTNGTVEEAKLVNSISKETPLPAPHGLSIWKDPNTGVTMLYVVIHSATNEGVAVFEVTKTPLTLTYVKTITDAAFSGYMNDLVVVAKDKFYISQSVLTRNVFVMAIELALSLPSGKLVYYDGARGRTVMYGLTMANGVAMSKDKRTLYVAEFGRKKIHAMTMKDDGDVETIWVSYIGSGPDNIHVDGNTGDLWVGTFPFMYKPSDLLGFFGPHQPVAQVLRVRLTDNKVTGIEIVYANDGSEASATSSALYKDNKLFIGTVTSQLVMCDINYLKP